MGVLANDRFAAKSCRSPHGTIFSLVSSHAETARRANQQKAVQPRREK
jgi:hypothetical protein